MTMPLSGSFDLKAELQAELRRSTPIVGQAGVMTDLRWLAERTTGQNLILPTHLYGKQAIKQTDRPPASPSDTSHSFAGVNLGDHFTGRALKILWFAGTKPSASVPGSFTLSGVTVAGTACTGGSQQFWQNGAGDTGFVSNGCIDVPTSVTATSGTINITTSLTTRILIAVISTAVNTLTVAGSGQGQFGSGTSHGTGSVVVTPANSILLAAAIRINSTAGNTLTMSGNDIKKDETVFSTNYRCVWGWENRIGNSGGRTVSSVGPSAVGVIGASAY